MKEWVISEEDLGCDGAYLSYDEVIRCKDCRKGIQTKNHLLCVNGVVAEMKKPDDYCSCAERREHA